MTVEHELGKRPLLDSAIASDGKIIANSGSVPGADTLIQRMSAGLAQDPSASYAENYSRRKTDRRLDAGSRTRRSPSEEMRFNRDQWYAMGGQQSAAGHSTGSARSPRSPSSPPAQQPLTPILKRRDPLSPGSDASDAGRARKQLNFSLDSDRSPVSGYESDRSQSPRFRSVSPYGRGEPAAKSDYYRHKDASHNKVGSASGKFSRRGSCCKPSIGRRGYLWFESRSSIERAASVSPVDASLDQRFQIADAAGSRRSSAGSSLFVHQSQN